MSLTTPPQRIDVGISDVSFSISAPARRLRLVIFQGKDDYITLTRRPDGTTFWRTASFKHLSDDYRFLDKCAFYSAGDRERVAG